MKTNVRSKVHQKQSESCMIWPHPRTASPSPQVLSTPGPPGLSWAALLWLRYKGRSSPPRPRGRQHSAPAGELPWSEGRASPARTARPRELLEGSRWPQGFGGNLNMWWCRCTWGRNRLVFMKEVGRHDDHDGEKPLCFFQLSYHSKTIITSNACLLHSCE